MQMTYVVSKILKFADQTVQMRWLQTEESCVDPSFCPNCQRLLIFPIWQPIGQQMHKNPKVIQRAFALVKAEEIVLKWEIQSQFYEHIFSHTWMSHSQWEIHLCQEIWPQQVKSWGNLHCVHANLNFWNVAKEIYLLSKSCNWSHAKLSFK